jgi:MFS family permease
VSGRDSEGSERHRLRDLPGFKPLIATYAVNDIGDLLAMVALAVFIYDGTGSVYALAAMFSVSRLAPSIVAPWMTARLAPLRVAVTLPVLYVIEAAVFATLAVLVSIDAPLGWLLVLAGLDGLLALTGRGLTRGVMATIFDEGGMLRAGNAFVSQLNAWLLVLATAGAFVLIELTSPVVAIWLDTATFLVAALIMTLKGRALPPAEVHEDEDGKRKPAKGRTREGLRHVWQRPRARRLVVGEGLAMLFGSLVIPVEVVYAKDALGAGSSAYGLLFAAWGLGSIIGATVFKRYHQRNLGIMVAAAATVVGIGYIGLALSPTLAIALFASVVGGAGNGAEWVAVMTALQETVDNEFYARASGLLEAIATGGPAIAYAGGAVLTAAAGPRAAYAVGGIASILVGIYWFARPVAGREGEVLPDELSLEGRA